MNRTRLTLLTLLAVVVLGAAVMWMARRSTDAAVDPTAGWPEQVSLTCTACRHRFDMPAADYLDAMSADPDRGPVACPACGDRRVRRTEHLDRPERRAGPDEG